MNLSVVQVPIASGSAGVLAASSLEAYFAAQVNWLLWLAAAVAVVLLVVGADRAVGAAVRLAKALGVPQVIIGATIVSLGTTAPEAFVSVSAAFQGNPGLALGNGVGSIICNAALIFGLCAVIKPLPKDRYILRRQGAVQLASAAGLLGICLVLAWANGSFTGVAIPRLVGLILVICLGLYLFQSARWAKVHPQVIPLDVVETQPGEIARRHPKVAAAKNLLMLAVGLALVILGSKIMIASVSELAIRYQVPQSVLAVTIVALGTSLPELATALASLLKGHPELLVGNVVGANILNVLFVVGASALAVPLAVDLHFFYLDLPVMVGILAMLRLFIALPGNRFRRWQGGLLLAAYVIFTIVLLKTNAPGAS